MWDYPISMDTEQRLVLLENDMKDAKERIGRHSARINSLEQNLIAEKGELTTLKGEVRVMDTTLKLIQEEQQEMSKKIDEIHESIDDYKEETKRIFRKFSIAIAVILVAIFIKDSATGSKIATVLSILSKA